MSEVSQNELAPSLGVVISGPSVGSYDHSSTPITTVKFDGTNYLFWSQSAHWLIFGRGKWGYITSDTPSSNSKDPTFPKWQAKDSLVLWLVQSM